MTAVVTDSAASLPTDVVAELGIQVVPMYLRFGDEVFRDGVDRVDVYGRLQDEGIPVTTASPSPGDFLEAFDRTGSEEIVCVTISSEVSGIYGSARVAAGQWSGRVEVVDSGNASMAEGFAVMEAARVARSGAGLDRVGARVREVADRALLVAVIDTFEFLRKSGRVKWLQSYAATMLGIKPVFRFVRGSIDPVARPRTKRRGMDRVLEEVVAYASDRPLHVAAVHAAAEDEARALLERTKGRTNVVESHVAEFSAAMGAHTGPGLVGLAGFSE